MASLAGTRCAKVTPFAVEAVEFPVQAWSAAEAQVANLTALAAALTHAAPACSCGGAQGTCRWSELAGGPRACSLADELAAIAPADAAIVIAAGDDLAHRYLQALAAIAPAIYLCRRVLHASNRCWFSTGNALSSTCGRVLAAAHGLQAGSPAS